MYYGPPPSTRTPREGLAQMIVLKNVVLTPSPSFSLGPLTVTFRSEALTWITASLYAAQRPHADLYTHRLNRHQLQS